LRSHARWRFRRFAVPGFLSGALLSAAGCGSTTHEIPLYAQGPVLVSLRSFGKGPSSAPRYEHPAELPSERVGKILAAVGIEEFSFFKWRNEGALLAAEDVAQLAPRLTEGLRKAGPDQWVYFSVRSTPKPLSFGVVRFSDGIGFVKNGQLNLVFGNIAYVENVDTTPSKIDPRDATTSDQVRLVVKATDLHGRPPSLVPGDRWLGRERRNWLVFDLSLAAVQPPEPPPVAATPVPSAPAAAAAPPAPVAAPADPADRLLRLKNLLDRGLITAEEYEKKRQEILKGL